MEEQYRNKASGLFEDGKIEELQKFLEPYLAKNDPYALYLSARFSIALSKESDQEFSLRAVAQMQKASEAGVAEESYRMGVNHLYGDDVSQDYGLASKYFERAILQGHSYSKFTYGYSLFYGKDQNPKNEKRGLALMQEAATEGVDKAKQELEYINGQKNV